MSRRRWLIPLAALAIGIVPALASTAASASTHPSRALAIRTGGTAQHVIKPGTVALGAHSGLRNETSSTNWSGYAADSGTYTSVSASWVQPTGTCSSRTDQYSSFWVGLDGYSSDSVEQDGTDTDCVNGKPQYYGWYETYPNPSYSFGSTVEPGDTITASVTYEGSNEFKLTLADTTRGWRPVPPRPYPGPPAPRPRSSSRRRAAPTAAAFSRWPTSAPCTCPTRWSTAPRSATCPRCRST